MALVSGSGRAHVTRLVCLILASAFLVANCYLGPGSDHFIAVLDELNVPAEWEAAQTETAGPGETDACDPMFSTSCPRAIRTYATGVDSPTAWDEAADAVRRAGYELTTESRSSCPSDWCGLMASRGTDRLSVTVLASIGEAGVEGDFPDGAAVEITAHGSK